MNDIEQNYDDFISTVSHELRTPLTSIKGFSQTMLSSWDKLDDDTKKKFIKIIEEQSQRLINLVENMLTVTKLSSNKNLLIYNEIYVKPIIEQVVAMVKTQYKDKIFELKFCSDEVKVFADKDKFQQILMNLIENSAKYSIDNYQINIEITTQNSDIIIKISNIGIGIDEKDYDKIFTKFSRIDNPLTRKTQGSGLGLYITKNLIEKMGGKVSIKSSPFDNNKDLSTITFTVSMPIKTIEEQARIKCNL